MMRAKVVLLFLGQLVLTVIGGHASPDYSGRSSDSVRAWAFSGGLWGLVGSWLITLALAYLASRARTGWTIAATVLSLAVSLVWVFDARLISFVGDVVFFRFP